MTRTRPDLPDSESHYRELLEQAAEGICLTDQGLHFILINQTFCAMLGYTKHELLKMTMANIVLEQDREHLASQLTAMLQGQTVYSEQYLRRKDGSRVLVDGSGKCTSDGTLQIVVRDITERKRSEETLKQTEAFYRALTEKSNEGVLVIDKDLIVLYRNPPRAHLSAYANEEMLGFNRSDLIHPEDLEVFKRNLAKLASDQTLTFIFRIKNRAGNWDYFESVITNLLTNPHIKGYVVNYRNISERKQTEEKLQQTEALYRAITEQSNEGVMVFDKDLVVRYHNASQLYGSANTVTRQDRTDAIHPDDLSVVLLELPGLRPGQTLLTSFRMQNNVGGWDWFEARVTQLLDHPAVQGYVANYYNINERKEAEAVQRELSQRLLGVQEEERRSLARELHDEIGQSLTAIKVGLQTAQRLGKLEPITNVLTITDGLLAQVRELSLSLHPKLLEDLGLVAAVRWYALQQSERSNIKVDLTLSLEEACLSPEMNLTIYRVVQEGITNVIRHSQATQVAISLTEKSNNVVLVIKDNGVGFDTSQQSKTSLGLLGMKERVVFLGGRFQLKSSLDAGTELYASFPLGA
jgi:PAS domain S-box-containing protein